MKGVRTVLVDWTKDDSGRWVMKERPDSEQVFDADMVSIEGFYLVFVIWRANDTSFQLEAKCTFKL